MLASLGRVEVHTLECRLKAGFAGLGFPTWKKRGGAVFADQSDLAVVVG